MCFKGEDMPPPTVRANSMDSSTSTNSVTSSRGPLYKESSSFLESDCNFIDERSSSSTKGGLLSNVVVSIILGSAAAAGMVGFANWFPFILAPEAASKTYDWAYYSYEDDISHFDNTAWTYGTDYALGVMMLISAYSILRYSAANFTDKLAMRSASLMLGCFVSVIAGGIAHQYYTTVESRNTLSFRFLWTVCVGCVTGASTFMGMSASEAVRLYQQRPNCSRLLRQLPVIPNSFWWSYGIFITTVCAMGGISFQRPACDIFIAGITQTPSTFYAMSYFILVEHAKVSLSTRIIGLIGFILNAPLLPMYPLLIQYTDWSLASVNTLLHCWLCAAWSMQGASLREVTKALVAERAEAVAYVQKMGKNL